MESAHAHIGSGRLGLGMVAAVGAGCGHTPIVLTRPDGDSGSTTVIIHEILRRTGAVVVRHPSPDGAFSSEEFAIEALAMERALEHPRIVDSNPLVVTLSIGTAIDDTTRRCLTEIVSARAGRRTFVVTCENRMGADYTEFLRHLASATDAIVLESVVDRICSSRRPSRDGNSVEIDTERYLLWVIENPLTPSAQQSLAGVFEHAVGDGQVALVDDILPYRIRKARMVNGPHTALALKTAVQRTPVLTPRTDQLLSSNEGVELMLRALLAAAAETLAEDYPGEFTEAELDDFTDETIERFKQHPDSVDRILNKLISEDYVEFVIGFHERLLSPASRGVSPELVEEIAADVTQVLHDRGLSGRFMTEVARRLSELRG